MEPFQARATDGRVSDRVQGRRRDGLLSGLVIGKAGPALAKVVVGNRPRHFLSYAGLSCPIGRKLKHDPANPPLEWTSAEQQKGYVVFPVNYTRADHSGRLCPSRAAIGKPVTAFATPGEFEPASFCISARIGSRAR